MLRTIGLMSGTSLDGVDAAWLETDGAKVGRFGPTVTIPYDPALRADLRRILDLAPSLAEDDPRLAEAVARLTDTHIAAVRALRHDRGLVERLHVQRVGGGSGGGSGHPADATDRVRRRGLRCRAGPANCGPRETPTEAGWCLAPACGRCLSQPACTARATMRTRPACSGRCAA